MNDISMTAPRGVGGAYGISKSLPVQGTDGADKAAAAQDGTFSRMVQESARSAVSTIREADAAAQAGLRGELGVQEVVESTLAAEASLKTVVGVRDKMVQAYQQIMRMPV